MRRTYYRYTLTSGAKKYPTRVWVAIRSAQRAAAAFLALLLIIGLNLHNPLGSARNTSIIQHVPGQDYQICDLQSRYLTSPWTYHALASGSQLYTVAQYQALPGYSTTLPPLPQYIIDEGSSATAAIIFAPGSPDIESAAYNFPESPILYFFEGGAYGQIGLQSVSGDEFIGGSATGYPEPQFNDGGGAGGINAGNDTFGFSGGSTTLTATANSGSTVVTTAAALPAYSTRITFSDGSTYGIASSSGTTTTLSSPLTSSESSGSSVWANSNPPIGTISAGAVQGNTTLTISATSIPLVKWGSVAIGDDTYKLTSVTGSQQSGYIIGVAGLDKAVAASTPVYYANEAGGVLVQYLDISNDIHDTTGTLTLGTGWTVKNNHIHDGYRSTAGGGVAFYGGDQSTIEYNCFAKMGQYGAGGSGTNQVFDYNEVTQSSYRGDPGCGCSGGGKWWGTLNADIIDNAFIEDGIGAGQGDIWFDNGNSGALVEGNYFYKDAGSSVVNETGYNMKVDSNLFLDDGWYDGTGLPSNGAGAVNINSTGGINIPGSRFENQVLVSNNQFIDDWGGVTIWQSTQRNCLGSGEGWPNDSAYCSGGFPITMETAANGQYYFSHQGDSLHGGTLTVEQTATSGSSSVYVDAGEAINDQIGFADPASTTTTDSTNVTSFGGSGTINVGSTSSFPSSGQLRVDTSAAGGGGGFTGAILSYTGKTSTTFTGVSLVRGSGTLSGPVLQVQPYKVTAETCYANQCKLTVTPSLSSNIAIGTTVTNAGTCPLFATSVATPTSPTTPGGSYWDGCQWQSRNISVTGNTFMFQPSLIADSAPPMGSSLTTQCTLAKNCGTNFMAFQSGGTAPYFDFTGGNAMMSSSTFTGCPDWDTGCTTDPLANLNALASPPAAPANNGETPYNNVWAGNNYIGPWMWSDVYSFSGCNPLPSDSVTGKAMPNADCGTINLPTWQSAWQQDQGSTYTPVAVTIGNLSDGQTIHGASQSVTAYEDTLTPNTINSSSLLVNNTTDSTVSNPSATPHTFSLNTLGHTDGSYTIKVSASDTGGNSGSDSVSLIIDNGDLNGDGHVNISDLAIMASHWGQTDSNYAHGNITGQSQINISDLAVLASNWGFSH